MRRALRRQAVAENMMNEMREPIFVMFAVAGLYVARAQLSVPMSELIVMAVLLYRTVGSLGRVQRQLQRAMMLEASHRAVHEMIAEVGAEREAVRRHAAADARARPGARAACRSASATKRVLDNVSITIPANRLTVIMGPSGVGKTTIIDLLLGLYAPQRRAASWSTACRSARSISQAGAAWSATCRRRSCCSTIACSPT